MSVCVCMFALRDSRKVACKSTDDKQGNHSPEGVIIELKTNDGNKLQEMIIIPFPSGTLRDALNDKFCDVT